MKKTDRCNTCSGWGCVSCCELWHNFKFWRLL